MLEQVDRSIHSGMFKSPEYQSGGITVQVNVREFLPQKEHDNPQKALILFQGWGPDIKASSYEDLASSLADSFSCRIFLANTRPEKLIADSLFHEATAMYQFLRDKNIADILIAGYSQGGALATNLAAICQKQSHINPEALILLAPAGLEPQTLSQVAASFALDTIGETIPRILMEKTSVKSKGESSRVGKAKQSLRTALDIAKGVTKEVASSGAKYPGRLLHEVKETTKLNPRLQEIAIPVIMIQGKHDRVLGPKGDLSKEQMAHQDKEGLVKNALQKLFPKSPYVTRVLARRTSNHAFILLRSPQISRVVSYLFERQKRLKKQG